MFKYLFSALALLAPVSGSVSLDNQDERELQRRFCGPYEAIVLFELSGKPARYVDDELWLIEDAFMSGYNALSQCDQNVTSCDFLDPAPNTAGVRGRELSVGFGTSIQPFTLAAAVTGWSCRRCPGADAPFPVLYKLDEDDAPVIQPPPPSYGGGRRLSGSGSSSSSSSSSSDGEVDPPRRPGVVPRGCRCDAPTNEEILDRLNLGFAANEIENVAAWAELGMQEVCPERTDFALPEDTFNFTVTGDISLITDEQVSIWNIAVQDVYNTINVLGSSTCDPVHRILGPVSTSASDITGTSMIATISGSGTCAGCPPTMGLWAPSEGGRRLKMDTAAVGSRKLVDLSNEVFQTYCLCSAEAAPRAPTRDEFIEALNAKIQVLRAEDEIVFIEMVS